ARLVAQVLAAASAAAEDAGLTPLALPPASRRAYEYLAALDLAGDRAPEAPGTVLGPPAVRIARIVRWSDRFLTRLRDISARPEQREVEAVRRRLSDVVEDIAIRCERAGASPADLPGPSRRAYQWMSFLVEPERLELHLRAQGEASRTDPRVAVDLYHLGGLYRFGWREGSARLVLSEAFVDAPPEVLRAAVKLAIPYTRKMIHRRTVRSYAAGPEFELRLLQLETSGGSFAERPHGVVHDLEAIFADVNRTQFEGRLTRPRLSWLATTSMREFGHFVTATDLVLVSSQLDALGVPRFVVEHVVHHELLHRELGATLKGGRRVYHTAGFRRAEKAFPRFDEADAFLEAFARGR
ncbi:MAG TPA: hypothetical protein VLD63_14935, partial [Anaerolineales bacterium]|nr:hypothetical protein [Anaerolineales bacterium]